MFKKKGGVSIEQIGCTVSFWYKGKQVESMRVQDMTIYVESERTGLNNLGYKCEETNYFYTKKTSEDNLGSDIKAMKNLIEKTIEKEKSDRKKLEGAITKAIKSIME